MKFRKVKSEISRIAEIENPVECQKEVKELDQVVNKNPKIKKIDRGLYFDFYIIHYKKDELTGKYVETPDKKIGKISKENFKKDQDKIEKLRKSGNLEEVIKFLEN